MNTLGFGVGGFSGQNNKEDIASILATARQHLNGGDPAAALQAVSGALEPSSDSHSHES